MDEDTARASFRDQAAHCARLSSPFTARLVETLGASLDHSTAVGARVLGWQGDPAPQADALALRLAGGLHALVRSGAAPDLAALYPPNDLPQAEPLAQRIHEVLVAHEATLLPWLDRAPQTNEVARAGILYPGLAIIAARTGLPLAVHELGASAGLNLVLDRYAYDLGSWQGGKKGSPLTLSPEWSGLIPPNTQPQIIARQGCDLAPIDLTDRTEVDRLAAYVWPDQPERHTRLSAAIELFREDPVSVTEADASEWVPEVLTQDAPSGITRVLMHSIAFIYLPVNAQAKVTQHMEQIGSTATYDTPLAWLAFELGPKARPKLTLRLWSSGEEETLATADPHVRSVVWEALA